MKVTKRGCQIFLYELEGKEDCSNHFCESQVMKWYKALPVIIVKRMKMWLLKVTYIYTF